MKSLIKCRFACQSRIKKQSSRILFLVPSIIGICIFNIIPFMDVVRRSFVTSVTEQFVGIYNYIAILHNQAFLLAIGNTGKFVLVCIPLLMILSLVIALMVSEVTYVQTIKVCYLVPLAIPTATVVLIWKILFLKQGLLNGIRHTWGLATVDFMGSDNAFWVLVLSYVWKNLGYTMILWMAGIYSISDSVIEAAKMDGATQWQKIYYIILPQLRTTTDTILILSFLNSFKVFREAYLVAGAYPHESIYLLQHLFNNWFVNLDLDKMAAATICIAVFLFCVVMLLQLRWNRSEN